MAIKVVLIRHAQVDMASQKDISDMGRAIQKLMDSYLKEIGLIPNEIWHSPIKRATETAEIIAEDFQVPLKQETSLGEYFDEIDLVEKLAEIPDSTCLFLVSHGPQLMQLTTYLLGKSPFKTQLPNSGVAVIEFRKKPKEGQGIFLKNVLPEMVMSIKGIPKL